MAGQPVTRQAERQQAQEDAAKTDHGTLHDQVVPGLGDEAQGNAVVQISVVLPVEFDGQDHVHEFRVDRVAAGLWQGLFCFPGGAGQALSVRGDEHQVIEIAVTLQTGENFVRGGVIPVCQWRSQRGLIQRLGTLDVFVDMLVQVRVDQAQAVADDQGDEDELNQQAGKEQAETQAAEKSREWHQGSSSRRLVRLM